VFPLAFPVTLSLMEHKPHPVTCERKIQICEVNSIKKRTFADEKPTKEP